MALGSAEQRWLSLKHKHKAKRLGAQKRRPRPHRGSVTPLVLVTYEIGFQVPRAKRAGYQGELKRARRARGSSMSDHIPQPYWNGPGARSPLDTTGIVGSSNRKTNKTLIWSILRAPPRLPIESMRSKRSLEASGSVLMAVASLPEAFLKRFRRT